MAHAQPLPAAVEAEEHHTSAGTYLKIGLVLFVLTALEVATYELAFKHQDSAFGAALHGVFVPVILALSALKFALVAMFYMHLKGDAKLLTGVFVFSLIIATVMIVGLMALMAYHFAFAHGTA